MARPSLLLALSIYAVTSSQSPTSFTVQDPKNYKNTSRISQPLTFNQDGTFQISIFEDLHFGENAWDPWGPRQDASSIRVINRVLDAETPGLVVLNGDLIAGEDTYLENSTAYVDQIVSPFVQRGLSWASTYGNHDHNFNLSGEGILAREQKFPGCRTRSMVEGRNAGVSNYYLPVYAPECHADECAPELLLWFFDSRGGQYFREQVPQPNWVDDSVVNWFQSTNVLITQRFGRVIPSLAFVHIPTHASAALQQEHGQGSIDPHLQPGINDDYPLSSQAQGWCADGRNDGSCPYGGQDVLFIKAIATAPGLIGLFSAHDHGTTWCYKWDHQVPGMVIAGDGVNLCFGQHSGYGGYGSWIRGSRQVRVSRDTLERSKWEAETWIRLESGDVVGSVNLNATYGRDRYPATPDDKTHCQHCDHTVIS